MPWRQWPPCPDCGSLNTIRVELPYTSDVLQCLACGAKTPEPGSDELADLLRRSEDLTEQSRKLQLELDDIAKRVRELLKRRLVDASNGPRERRKKPRP